MNRKKYDWIRFWNYANKIGIIFWILSFFITISQIWPQVNKTTSEVQQIQQKLKDSSDPQAVLYSFFAEIESWNLKWAYSLFTEEKKKNNPFDGFKSWLENIVSFQWLTITPIPEKTSALQRVYLIEYDFQKRWMKPVKTKMWYTLILVWNTWKINYSTDPLYENGWKDGACNFYKFSEHCN